MKDEVIIREIEEKDNKEVARVIRQVMPEFGATGAGFAIVDPQVDQMYETYYNARSLYLIVELNSVVMGGAGIAPLVGCSDICELQKMYFSKEVRGLGIGQEVMNLCLSFAKKYYKSCYIETLSKMQKAKKLYEKNGFCVLDAPLGDTGHFGCDNWYIKSFK